jgi:hypothetical protein
MNVPDKTLSRLLVHAQRIQSYYFTVGRAVMDGQPEIAEERLQNLLADAGAMVSMLLQAGAVPPDQDLPVLGAVPIDKLDTPANRRLLAKLEEAYEAARAVDEERWPGIGSHGMAQGLELEIERVRMEIFGPTT